MLLDRLLALVYERAMFTVRMTNLSPADRGRAAGPGALRMR